MKRISKLLLAIALIISLVSLSSSKIDTKHLESMIDRPVELFKSYYELFQKYKEYDINSKAGVERFEIFKSNIENIKKGNTEAGTTVYGITPYTDMTQEEFTSSRLMKPGVFEKQMKGLEKDINNSYKPSKLKIDTTTLNIDWTDKLPEVRNQGSCGSCWAFASVSAIEGNYNIKFNKNVTLSEQYLVDCDNSNLGCNGGSIINAYEFIKSGGMQYLDDKEYTGYQNICVSKAEKKEAINILSSYNYCESCTEDDFYSKLSEGPAVVAMYASYLSSSYKPTNIETPWEPSSSDCPASASINHAVTVVGAKSVIRTVNGKQVNDVLLKIRNSWGSNWGVNGYFSVYASNSCFIMKNIYFPVVKSITASDTLPAEKCSTFRTKCDKSGTEIQECDGISSATKKLGGDISYYKPYYSNVRWFNFFTEDNCRGTKRPYSNSYEVCFENNYVNKIRKEYAYKSMANDNIYYTSGCVYLFYDTCFEGGYAKVCDNIEDISTQNFSPELVESMVIPKFTYPQSGAVMFLVLCDETQYRGNCESISVGEYYNMDGNEKVLNLLSKTKSIALLRKK